MKKFVVVCDNLRSCFNVGSIFRTSDALKVDCLYLCGITPDPKTNFEKIQKTALGAIESVSWQKVSATWRLLEKLKKEKFFIIALENVKSALPFYEFNIKKSKAKNLKIALVLGNEVKGLSKKILKRCDLILKIPMEGKKESLNVAIAFAIVGFYLKYLAEK